MVDGPVFPLKPFIKAFQDDPAMTHHKWVQWACDCVERVLPVYDTYAPREGSIRQIHPKEVLEAVKRWLADPNPDNARAARRLGMLLSHFGIPKAKDARSSFVMSAAARVTYLIHDLSFIGTTAYTARKALDWDDAVEEEKWQTIRLLQIYHEGESDA